MKRFSRASTDANNISSGSDGVVGKWKITETVNHGFVDRV